MLLVSWDLVTQVQATETTSPEMGLWLYILSYVDSALVGASCTATLFCGNQRNKCMVSRCTISGASCPTYCVTKWAVVNRVGVIFPSYELVNCRRNIIQLCVGDIGLFLTAELLCLWTSTADCSVLLQRYVDAFAQCTTILGCESILYGGVFKCCSTR